VSVFSVLPEKRKLRPEKPGSADGVIEYVTTNCWRPGGNLRQTYLGATKSLTKLVMD